MPSRARSLYIGMMLHRLTRPTSRIAATKQNMELSINLSKTLAIILNKRIITTSTKQNMENLINQKGKQNMKSINLVQLKQEKLDDLGIRNNPTLFYVKQNNVENYVNLDLWLSHKKHLTWHPSLHFSEESCTNLIQKFNLDPKKFRVYAI